MAPVSDVELDGDRAVSREDCLCPICLEIYIEPVTLPCTHTFCKGCFLESVDKATLCCPLCRKRVSTWARVHSRNKTLVNEKLWKRIQTAFPRQCTSQGEGPEGEEPTEPLFFPKLSEPGALRQEYQDQVNKLSEEKERERRASEEYIQRLLAEEEQHLLEQQRRHQDDERLARLLSQELNSRSEASPSRVPEVTPVKKGHIDRFLSPVFSSHSSNKENILLRLNSPTDLPQLDYYGPDTDQSEQAQTDQPLNTDQSERAETDQPLNTDQSEWAETDQPLNTDQSERAETDQPLNTDQSEAEDRRVEGGTKRKSSKVFGSLSDQEDGETQGKRSCQSSCLMGVAMAEWEAELQKRRRQEEDDRLVALTLQRELNRQERQTDRRKGSVDAYPLRAPERRKPHHRSATVSTPSAKTPHTRSATVSIPSAKTPHHRSATVSTPSAKTPHHRSATVSASQAEGNPDVENRPPSAPKATSTTKPPSASSLKTQKPKTPQRQMTLTDIFMSKLNGRD